MIRTPYEVNKTVNELQDLQDISNEPTGFNRNDLSTLPYLEYSEQASNGYTRLHYDKVNDTMTYTEFPDATEFSNGQAVTDRTLAVCNNDIDNAYFYLKSKKYEIKQIVSSALTKQHSNEAGSFVWYMDDSGLQIHKNPNRREVAKILQYNVLCSVIYYNDDLGKSILFADEMHGYNMSGATHASKHLTDGCKFGFGLQLIGVTADGDDTYDKITEGDLWDEDIRIDVPESTTNAFIYRDGDTGKWIKTDKDNNLGYVSGSNSYYNKYDGSTWSLTQTDDNKCVIMHIMSSNDIKGHLVKVIGQAEYGSWSEAKQHVHSEINTLQMNGVPTPEFVWLYSYIVKDDGSLQIGDNNELYLDHRLGVVSAGKIK